MKISKKLPTYFGWLALALLGLTLFKLIPTPDSAAASLTANDSIPAYIDEFRFGTNMGHRNTSWSDSQHSDLVAAVGMNSHRVSLPENYLVQWTNVALNNMKHYKAVGQLNLTAFLGTPTLAHSTAPDSGSLYRYPPKNLYEPIFNGDGSVNQNNYWASYVYSTAMNFKSYVKIWEIWNEPDYTANYNATQTSWYTSPPNPADLSTWNGSVFSYIRMLRISYEVIKKADPNALIAVGGIGYESFLDCILRYTDDPNTGAVSAAYPLKGGAYFDVLSYHYYPQFGVKSSATGQWNLNTDSDNDIDKLLTARDNFKARLAAYNYGTSYPAKYFIVTESGISTKPIGNTIGDMNLLRNYLMKVQVYGRKGELSQLHTFMLTDTEADSASTDSFKHMGLYYDIAGLANTSQAVRKSASYGVETIARVLSGTTYLPAATAALNLPATVRGAVFQGSGTEKITVLWAKTPANSETAAASLTLASNLSLGLRDWQWSQTKTEQLLVPTNGQIQLNLTGVPIVLVSKPTYPILSQQFDPFLIAQNGTSYLNFTIKNPNPNSSLSGVGFSSTLPAQIKINTTPNLISTCPGGQTNATAGGSSIALSGANLAANQSCSVSVQVTSNSLGTWSVGGVAAKSTETGLGSNIASAASLTVVSPFVVTITGDTHVDGETTLREAVSNAAGTGGGLVTFDAGLGSNPQINLTAPLVLSAKVGLQASCSNRVRLRVTTSLGGQPVLKLSGFNYLNGIDIISSSFPGIFAVSGGSQVDCTSVKPS